MHKKHKTVEPFCLVPSQATLWQPNRRVLWSARTAGLMIAGVCCLCTCAVVPADDVALLSDIRKAWQARQDHTTTVYARWARSEQTSLAPDVPPDPQGSEPRIETLQISNRSVRYESDSRRYDIDGGPRGSMSWQTGTCVESYNPDDGWRRLLDSDLEVVKPSATINRPDFKFHGMWGKLVLLLWYRGADPNLSLFEFIDWKVCHDSRFAHPDSEYVTLIAGETGRTMTLLFLDSSLGYLPVGSRSGKWPAENAPFRNYKECIVTVDENATALDCRPKNWTSQFNTATGQILGITVCQIQDFRIGEPLADELFKVEFPDGVHVYDDAAADFPGEKPSQNKADVTTPKHGWHLGYYLSSLFAVVLAAAVFWKMRANRLSV